MLPNFHPEVGFLSASKKFIIHNCRAKGKGRDSCILTNPQYFFLNNSLTREGTILPSMPMLCVQKEIIAESVLELLQLIKGMWGPSRSLAGAVNYKGIQRATANGILLALN